jgi:peroxiredoxin
MRFIKYKMSIKNIGYVVLASIAFISCKDKSKFEIEGTFKNATPQNKVYLFALDKENSLALDSTVLSEKGAFKFSHPTPGVDFFKVTAGTNEYMIIAKNGDDVKLEADLADKTMHYSISGAEEADKLQELNVTKNKYMTIIAGIQKEFEDQVEKEPQKRTELMERISPKYTQEITNLNVAILKFAKENSKSLAGFYAINLLNPSEYEQDMVKYSDEIRGNFSNNAAVTEFMVRMAKLKTVQVGEMAPDFTMNTIEGKPVSLSGFKGKYVLLDFWASWCQPCRQENPNVVKAFQTYKNRNFTVFSVSLDKDPVAWKQAVDADHLTWTHGSELKDFEGPAVRLFHVEAIPSSFIIDPSGKIVAKNLRGVDLENFLNKTLPQS